jgi:hypothetical protein
LSDDPLTQCAVAFKVGLVEKLIGRRIVCEERVGCRECTHIRRFVDPLISRFQVDQSPHRTGHPGEPVSQYSPEPPLDSIFTEQANKRHAYCISTPRHAPPNCASYEKSPTGAGPISCVCKSVPELLPDVRAELNRESSRGDAFAGALVIVLVVGGLGGIVIATCGYRVQMRARRKALRPFMAEAAEEASRRSGIPMIATVDGGDFALALAKA